MMIVGDDDDSWWWRWKLVMMMVILWWKLSSHESYLVTKVIKRLILSMMIGIIVKEVMTCDVSPVAMFYLNSFICMGAFHNLILSNFHAFNSYECFFIFLCYWISILLSPWVFQNFNLIKFPYFYIITRFMLLCCLYISISNFQKHFL